MYFKIIFLYLPVVFRFFKKVLKSVESYIFISEKINTKKTCLFKNWCKKFSFDRKYQDIIGSTWFMMSWKHDIKLETCGKVLKILTKAVLSAKRSKSFSSIRKLEKEICIATLLVKDCKVRNEYELQSRKVNFGSPLATTLKEKFW